MKVGLGTLTTGKLYILRSGLQARVDPALGSAALVPGLQTRVWCNPDPNRGLYSLNQLTMQWTLVHPVFKIKLVNGICVNGIVYNKQSAFGSFI